MKETFCLLIKHQAYPVATFPLSVKTEGSLIDSVTKTVQCSHFSTLQPGEQRDLRLARNVSLELKLHDAKMHNLSVSPHQPPRWLLLAHVLRTCAYFDLSCRRLFNRKVKGQNLIWMIKKAAYCTGIINPHIKITIFTVTNIFYYLSFQTQANICVTFQLCEQDNSTWSFGQKRKINQPDIQETNWTTQLDVHSTFLEFKDDLIWMYLLSF